MLKMHKEKKPVIVAMCIKWLYYVLIANYADRLHYW